MTPRQELLYVSPPPGQARPPAEIRPMPPRLPAPRRRSLAEGIVDALATRIRTGALPPGTRLPTEPEMTAEYGVSRTVVREAISRLQAAGLVETRHGIGTFVLDPPRATHDLGTVLTIRDVVAMLELRISLETEAAALAAHRREGADLDTLRAAIADFEAELAAGRNGVEADFRFHMGVVKATRNRWFETVFAELGTSTLPRSRLQLDAYASERGTDYLHRANREHEAIVEAIERGDAEGARAAMRMHLTNSRERLKRLGDEVAATAAGPV